MGADGEHVDNEIVRDIYLEGPQVGVDGEYADNEYMAFTWRGPRWGGGVTVSMQTMR